MKDTYYFTHDYYSRHDKAMVNLQMKKGVAAIGVYWCIVEMLYEENGYLNIDEYERITFELRCEYDLVKYVIEDSGLFKITENFFYSETILNRLKIRDEKSKKATNSVNKRWQNQRVNTNVLQTYNDSNTIKESKVKESKENKIKDIKERKEIFKEKLKPFIEVYGKDLLNNFFLYWTEHNEDGKKMRFEMEKVFDIKRRLITWNKNNTKNNYTQKTAPLIADTSEVDKARRLQQEYLNSLKKHESLINQKK